jgi:hypothetical protein
MSEVEYTTDWRGNEIRVGTLVLYPRMSGRSCEIQEGYVEQLSPVERRKYNYDTREYEQVTEYKYKILPTRSSRGFGRGQPRTVTIHIGENVTSLEGP